MKIGVLTPTYNRPDFARLLVLQMQNQRLRPDVVCIHQNGTVESYEWAVADIHASFQVHWLHTPHVLPQDDWYAKPLAYLIDQGCTHFFWCDHDDLYGSSHILNGVLYMTDAGAGAGAGAGACDFVVNSHCGLLKLKTRYEYTPSTQFKAHAPGGMSSSMSFNRAFAVELLADIERNLARHTYGYTDQVLAFVTKPKFRSHVNTDPQATTIYVSHPTASTSAQWLVEVGSMHRPLVDPEAALQLPGLTISAHLANVGDVVSTETLAVCGGKRPAGAIQGFTLRADDGSPARLLQYRARLHDGSWTDWTPCNHYVGTRGLHQNLTGYTVRVDDGFRSHVSLELWGKFENEAQLKMVAAPADCVSANEGSALLGMQLLFRSNISENTDISIKKNLISCSLIGGLGNQMFQAAHAIAQGLRYDRRSVFLRKSWTPMQGRNASNYVDNIFGKLNFVDNIQSFEKVKSDAWEFVEVKPLDGNTCFEGYFQSSKNFLGFDDEIKNIFSPPKEFVLEAYRKFPELSKERTVSIHVRLGDYVKNSNIHPSVSKSYLDRALEIIGPYDHLFLFGDDKEWLRKYFFGKNMTLIDEIDYKDMWIMSLCSNNIISNSTFSWWGAFLNKNKNKHIIAPSIWFGPDGPQNYKDIFQLDWTVVDLEYKDGELVYLPGALRNPPKLS